MRGSVARSLVPKRKARPGVANGSIRGAVAAQAVEEENHSPASGGDTQIAQPKPKRRGRPSSPDSASKSESYSYETYCKEDSNSEKHTSGSEVEEEEVDYGGSSTSSGKEDSNREKHTSGSEVEEQKENQQQGRPLAAQA